MACQRSAPVVSTSTIARAVDQLSVRIDAGAGRLPSSDRVNHPPASAHNLYVKEHFAYQANYRHGPHVLDVSDPENPREIGTFDTTPFLEGPGFSGAWSTYPFFRSGTVIVTSVQEGLFLLKPRPRSPVFWLNRKRRRHPDLPWWFR